MQFDSKVVYGGIPSFHWFEKRPHTSHPFSSSVSKKAIAVSQVFAVPNQTVRQDRATPVSKQSVPIACIASAEFTNQKYIYTYIYVCIYIYIYLYIYISIYLYTYEKKHISSFTCLSIYLTWYLILCILLMHFLPLHASHDVFLEILNQTNQQLETFKTKCCAFIGFQ